MVDKLRLIRGKPLLFGDCPIYSPLLDDVAEIGEVNYAIFLMFATFQKSKIIELMPNEFVGKDHYDSDFDCIVSSSLATYYAAKAISFFMRREVSYSDLNRCFFVDDRRILDRDNYLDFIEIVKQINVLKDDGEKTPMKFKNEESKRFHEKVLRLREKYNKNKKNSFELKDIISVLCCADGNGISHFNVGTLTIYQLYDSWERYCLKESSNREFQFAVNGMLKDLSTLKNWISQKTQL